MSRAVSRARSAAQGDLHTADQETPLACLRPVRAPRQICLLLAARTRGSFAALPGKLVFQPSLGRGPIAFHRCRRYVQKLGGFGYFETGKIAQLDDLYLLLIDGGKPIQ